MKKFKLLLLDANVIIELMRVGKWDAVVDACQLVLGETVLDESHFYEDNDRQRHDFDLQPYIDDHRVETIGATLQQFKALDDIFQPQFLSSSIHDGEKELLAIVCSSREPWSIVAADIALVNAMAALAKTDQLLSVEVLLQKIGQQSPALKDHYKESRLRQWIKWGQTEALQGKIKK